MSSWNRESDREDTAQMPRGASPAPKAAENTLKGGKEREKCWKIAFVKLSAHKTTCLLLWKFLHPSLCFHSPGAEPQKHPEIQLHTLWSRKSNTCLADLGLTCGDILYLPDTEPKRSLQPRQFPRQHPNINVCGTVEKCVSLILFAWWEREISEQPSDP